MPHLSQAPRLEGLLPSHGAFQEHVAHIMQWSIMLNSKGSLSTCIPKGVSTFLHAAFTAHPAFAPGAIGHFHRAVPAFALGARFLGAMRGALRGVSGWLAVVGLQPLARILDLGLDAGEVDPA